MRKFLPLVAVMALVFSASQALAADTATDRRGDGTGRRHTDMMQRMDKDGDGKVSKAEFVAGAEERFTKMDTNSDGFLTKEDRPQRPGRDQGDDKSAPPPPPKDE